MFVVFSNHSQVQQKQLAVLPPPESMKGTKMELIPLTEYNNMLNRFDTRDEGKLFGG